MDQIANDHGVEVIYQPLLGLVSLVQLAEVSRRMLAAYTTELMCRRSIATDALHATVRDQQLVYLAAWIHQPSVNELDTTFAALLQSVTDAASRTSSAPWSPQ